MKQINIKYLNKFLIYLAFLIPISLVTGPFIPDLFVSIIAIIYAYILFVRNEIKILLEKKNLIFIFFCIYLIIISIFSVDILSSILPGAFYIRFGLFTLAIVYLLKEYPNFENLFTKYLLITILFVSVDAYIQIIFGYNMLGMKNSVVDRVSGLFGDEYVLGSYLVRLFPLLLALLINKISFNLKNKILFIIGIVLFNVLIFFIAERTAFALNIIFFVLFTLIIKKTRFLMILIFVFSALGFIFAGNLSKSTHERMINQTINEVFKDNKINIFTEGHQNHIKTAIKIFKDNIIIGSGIKSFRILCREKRYYETVTSCSTHPHNTYAQLLSETGFIGFVLIFGIFLMICKNLFLYFVRSFFKKNDSVNDQVKILSILIFINLFPFVPTGSFFNNWMSIMYFLPLGFFLKNNKFI